MYDVINVKTRKQFNAFLKALKKYKIKVVDTETNGLHPYAGNHIISISVFFPESGETYNIAFWHGVGQVEIKWTDKYPAGTPFEELTWQGKAKKQMFLDYWFTKFRAELDDETNYFGNLPAEWLEEVKAVWGQGTYILHNSRFDAHFLYAAGFPDMENVYDTMIALHIVNEDWRHIQLNAPYTYTYSDAPSKEKAGTWAVDAEGKLMKRLQYGNRQLKWQSALHGFREATAGETALFDAIKTFEETLTDYIIENIHDPMNDGLRLAKVQNGTATPEDWVKQREKVRAKVELDNKANLWMLPSDLVAYYAGLDVILTWDLYEWSLKVIAQWHNEDLFEKQSRIHHKVAWEMERNGFKLDIAAAQAQIEKLQPRIEELEDLLARLAMEWGLDNFNANSPAQLLKFLNSGILGGEYDKSIFPDWWDVNLTLGLKTYPNIGVSAGDLEDVGDELYGTDKRELEKVEDHMVVRMVKELRRMHKSVNTYLKKWIAAADENGIVRFSVNDDGTVAGRASSSGDAGNGQNIPERGGYTIKEAIVEYDKHWHLMAWDYGQLELRLGAWIGETLLGFDPNMTMTKLFLSGEDMHAYVRDIIGIRDIVYPNLDDKQILVKIGYDLKHAKVNTAAKQAEVVADHLRQIAKTMNFGLLYSGGGRMLSKLLKIDEDVATVLVKKWRKMFPAFPLTQQYITDAVLERRLRPDNKDYGMYYTQPITGRHRKLHLYSTSAVYFQDGEAKVFNPREAAARKVWNNTDQGLGGFLCLYSAYLIGEELGRDKIKMFVNIHDALEMYVHDDALHLVPRIGEIMTDWPQIDPALTVDAQGSKDGTWQGMAKIKDMDKWIATKGKEGYGK